MRLLLVPFLALPCCGIFAQTSWTLEQCVARAEERSLSTQQAAYDQEFAGQNERLAKWGFWPNLNAAATHGYNWGQTIDRYTNTFATDRVRTDNFWLGSTWTLFGGLRQQNQLKKARLDVRSASESLAAARVTVRSLVVARYMEMLSAKERIKAATLTADRTREQITFTDALVTAGRLARVELLNLQAQLAREEYDLITAENQLVQSRLRMAQLLQLNTQEAAGFDVSVPEIGTFEPQEPTVSVDQVMAHVRETHPSFKKAQMDVESAERSIEIARAGGIPSLQFSANVASGYSGRDEVTVGEPIQGPPILAGYTESGEGVYTPNVSYNTETKAFGDQLQDNVNYSTSWTLNVPLFNNMTNRAAIQQARIRFDQARLRQLDQEQQLQLSVQQAITDQRAGFRRYKAASNAFEASQEALVYTTERFQQGAATALELSTAKTNLNKASTDLITARYDYLVATKSLDILQGLPLTL